SCAVSQYKGRSGGIIKMPETNLVFTRKIPDGEGGANQSAVIGESAERNQGFYGILNKIIPGFEAVENLRAHKTKDGAKDDDIPYPVVRPDPDLSFFRLRQFLFVSLPPFHGGE